VLPVTLPNYQSGQIVGGNVFFAPETDIPARGIAKIDYLLDSTVLASQTTAPFSYNWVSTGATPGLRNFTFAITDIAGNTGQLSMDLNVTPPVSVEITAPAERAAILWTNTITANVSALGTVVKVEFAIDGQPLGTVTSPPYEMVWDPSGLPAGRHTVTVTATDTEGFTGVDENFVNIPPKSLLWIALIILVVVGGVLIPIAVQKRKRFGMGGPGGSIKPGQVSLQELEGLNPGMTWPLGTLDVRLGRKHDENDIVLKGLKASRMHAIIRYQQGQYIIEALNPDNPLLINEQPTRQHILRSGDTIRLGETLLRFG
jgi:hypothetical protein